LVRRVLRGSHQEGALLDDRRVPQGVTSDGHDPHAKPRARLEPRERGLTEAHVDRALARRELEPPRTAHKADVDPPTTVARAGDAAYGGPTVARGVMLASEAMMVASVPVRDRLHERHLEAHAAHAARIRGGHAGEPNGGHAAARHADLLAGHDNHRRSSGGR